MPHLGHILVGDADQNTARNRLLSLKHAGYKGWHASESSELQQLAADKKPDVILLGQFDDPSPMKIAEQLRNTEATARIPIFLLELEGTDALRKEAIEAGIADIADYRVGTDVLLARLPRIVRMSRLVHELERRIATAADLGRDIIPMTANDSTEAPDDYKILIVANETLYERSAYSSVLQKNFDCTVEPNPYLATDLIDKGDFDVAAIMADCSDDRDKVSYFCTHVRNHTRLNALPILAVDDSSKADMLYRVGASVVLDRQKDASRSAVHIKLLVNRQRYQRTLLRPLADVLGPETADSDLPRAYSGEFFKIHLRRSIFAAIDRETSVGVASFTIPTIARIRDTIGNDQAAALKEKVLNRISELVRATDTVAVLGDQEFGVILCDADDGEGYRIANRITGILQSTSFDSDGAEATPRIIVQCGVAGLKPADDAERLLARARENLF